MARKPRKRANAGRPPVPLFTPTPAQIAAECREIQSEWTDAERVRRANGNRGGVEGPRSYRLWAEVVEV